MARERKKQPEHTGPTRASLTKSASMPGWLEVTTPYDWRFVDELKGEIQWPHRKWVPELGVWVVHEMFAEELVGMLSRHFDEVVSDLVEDDESDENVFAKVFRVVNGQYRDKVYTALAQALHPDHGGTHEQMVMLNEAYERAKEGK